MGDDMTQEAIQITETPPLPGLKLVQDLNKALQTLATDFAGSSDPAALAGPFMTWADTGNMLLKRRNAANTEWVTLGPLLDFFFARGNILGTVSQSGGDPTGAIIESGSNANGFYIRYADGTQICRRLSTDTPTIASAAGSVFVNGAAIGPYQWAAEFSSEPTEMLTSYKLSGSASHSWVASVDRPTVTQTSSFQLFRSTSSGDAYFVAIVAIGRWF